MEVLICLIYMSGLVKIQVRMKLELQLFDAVLGGRAVQHGEIQGHESDKLLSYVKPCEGGVATGFKTPEEEVFETRLYTCKGKRAIRLKQVPFARSSNIQERAKALEVVNDDNIIPKSTPPKLYSITDGQMEPIDGDLSKSMLDCGAEVFIWVGRVTQVDERKAASQSAEEFLASENRPKAVLSKVMSPILLAILSSPKLIARVSELEYTAK